MKNTQTTPKTLNEFKEVWRLMMSVKTSFWVCMYEQYFSFSSTMSLYFWHVNFKSTYYKYFSSMILYLRHDKFELVVPERLSQLKASMHVIVLRIWEYKQSTTTLIQIRI